MHHPVKRAKKSRGSIGTTTRTALLWIKQPSGEPQLLTIVIPANDGHYNLITICEDVVDILGQDDICVGRVFFHSAG